VKFLKNVFRLYLLQNIVRIFQYEVWHVILRSQGSRFKGSGFRGSGARFQETDDR
jgi:hypothetical protein